MDLVLSEHAVRAQLADCVPVEAELEQHLLRVRAARGRRGELGDVRIELARVRNQLVALAGGSLHFGEVAVRPRLRVIPQLANALLWLPRRVEASELLPPLGEGARGEDGRELT